MEWKPKIVITPKTLISAVASIVGVMLTIGTVIWTGSEHYTGLTNRISSLEQTRELRNEQIKDIQNNIGDIKADMTASKTNQTTIMSQLKSIQDDQRLIFGKLMEEKSAMYNSARTPQPKPVNF